MMAPSPDCDAGQQIEALVAEKASSEQSENRMLPGCNRSVTLDLLRVSVKKNKTASHKLYGNNEDLALTIFTAIAMILTGIPYVSLAGFSSN